MDELRTLLMRDIQERELIKAGLKRVKSRQLILILVGVLILIMFSFNFLQVRKQINMMNEVTHVANALIKAQEEEMDSLLNIDLIQTKK